MRTTKRPDVLAAAAATADTWGTQRPTQLPATGPISRPVPDDAKVHANEVCRHSSPPPQPAVPSPCAALIGPSRASRRSVHPAPTRLPQSRAHQGLPELANAGLTYVTPGLNKGQAGTRSCPARANARAEVARTSNARGVHEEIIDDDGGYAAIRGSPSRAGRAPSNRSAPSHLELATCKRIRQVSRIPCLSVRGAG